MKLTDLFKKAIFIATCYLAAVSCSKDEGDTPRVVTTELQVSQCEVLTIDAPVELKSGTTYQWKVEATTPETYSITEMSAKKVEFAAIANGVYTLSLVAADKGEPIYKASVVVKEKTCSPYIAKIFDFMPAVGQFTNVLPDYKEGDTKETILKKVEEYIAGENKKKYMVSLGGFGGYVTFGFDHTIVNIPGLRDFRVLGNAFYANANPNPDAPKKGGSCEPGVIMVAYDRNKNGKPDDDEWYEIAGSEYNNPKAVHNYEITYYRPDPNKAPKPDGGFMSDTEYIKWTDNQGHSGYKSKNTFHDQSYFPSWIKEDKITFKGTLLPNNAKEESGAGKYWVLYAFDFGYVDNILNTDDDSAIDIDWAVDAKGNKVHLPGIDFVKVYTGLNQECGWLGESSTEVMGANDLHLLNLKVKTR
jgi:hypothetical protein